LNAALRNESFRPDFSLLDKRLFKFHVPNEAQQVTNVIQGYMRAQDKQLGFNVHCGYLILRFEICQK